MLSLQPPDRDPAVPIFCFNASYSTASVNFLQYLNCPYAFHDLAAHPDHRPLVIDADRFTMEEGMQFEKVVLEVFDQKNKQAQINHVIPFF